MSLGWRGFVLRSRILCIYMKNAIITLGVGLGIAAAYHFLLAKHFHGWPLAIVALLCIGASIGLRFLVQREQSAWPFLFLIPAICGIGGSILYSHDVVTVFAPLAIGVSLALFVFWHSTHASSMFAVRRLVPPEIWQDTVFPFRVVPRVTKEIWGFKHGSKALQGLLLALPFVILFVALFSSADPLFRRFLDESIGRFIDGSLIVQLVIDVFVACYVAGSSWLLIERAKRRDIQVPESDEHMASSQAVLLPFLGVLNALFVVFLGFQAVFFFGGEQALRAADLTYAEYARGGFFQLLVVSGFVFLITWFVYTRTVIRQKWARIAALVLIAQTAVVLVSAVMRLGLYVDVYGMTVTRFWAYAGMAYVGILLAFVGACLCSRFSVLHTAKVLFISMLSLPSFLLLWNVEATVVRYNLKHMSTFADAVQDMSYVMDTTPAAWPAIIAVLPTLSEQQQEVLGHWMEELANQSVIPADIRDIRLTDIFAEQALRSLLKP